MFKEAASKYSGIPFLRGPDDKRLDGDQIRVRVQEYRDILNQDPLNPDAIPETILDAVEDLVNHQSRLRRGSWEPCQSTVCEALDWSEHGEKLFGVRKQKKSKSLAEKTREHFEREHPGKLQDVHSFLDDLEDITRSQAESDKEAFFEKYEDEIRTSKRLYEEWRRELFATTVTDEPDLLTAILDGIRTVLIKNFVAVQEGEDDARFFVSVKGCEKASTWENLDSRTFALFRHEARLLSGVLKKTVEFRFGKWLDADVIKNAVSQSRKESRLIELEVGIILKDKNKDAATQKVRVFWRPSESGQNSISLAWPDDIKGLFSGFSDDAVRVNASKITPKGTSASGHLPMSLLDTSTFSDVFGAEEGQTANPAGAMPEHHVFREIEDTLDSLIASKQLDDNVKTELLRKVSDFRESYSETIRILWEDPAGAYISDNLHKQALRFGELCTFARLHLADTFETRDKLLRKICEFGIVTSSSSSSVAIIPAWHPLRLLERQEKAKYVASFIETLSEDRRVTVDGLERACRRIKQLLATWCFPEIASVNFEIYAAVEHCGGYSLAVPVSEGAGNLEALEATSRVASQEFMKVADEYLALKPHEENSFSTAIYNAETVGLPSDIAEDLERKMVGRDNLRCSLLITHDNQDKMREAYTQQAAILQDRSLGGPAAGFLSRLRVGVRTGNSAARGERRPDIDIVFLHEAFFRNSSIGWDFVDGESEDLPDYVDLTNNLLPRRQGGDEGTATGARVVQTALSPAKLPRPVAQFIDLCFTADVNVRAMKRGHRAIPIRRISSDSAEVASAINNAHNLGEWVVSFDHLLSRDMLAKNGIQVIRDMLVPGTEARLIVSSREPSHSLLRQMTVEFQRMSGTWLASSAMQVSELAITTVVQVAGKKVMAAGRSEKTAKEIIGLAAATGLIRAIQERQGTMSVWFSLDDNKATFGLREKLADTLAVSVRKSRAGKFIIDLTVVEAKCVSRTSEATEAKSSREQTLATMRVLRDNFVDQSDAIARRAWGAEFLSLLSLRPEFSRLLATRDDLASFKDDLVRGRVGFTVQGRSVVVLHDDDQTGKATAATLDTNDSMLVQHRLGLQALAELMRYLDDPKTLEKLSIEDPLTIEDVSERAPAHLEEQKQPVVLTKPVSPSGEPGASDGESSSIRATTDKPAADIQEPTAGVEPSTVHSYPDRHQIPPPLRQALLQIVHETGAGALRDSDMEVAHATASKLQAALMGYGMQAVFTSDPLTSTPNGVIVRFKGHDTLTVKKIDAKKDELKSTHALDVIDARSGLGEISFYIARSDRQVVSLADVWLKTEWPSSAPNRLASLLVGTREDNGMPLWLNLTEGFGGNEQHGPHTLIAGETGSGKGVLIQNLLLQLIALNDPKNLKLFVIDPKLGADFFWISEAPHLVGGIAASQEESEEVLDGLVAEMERRYDLISGARTPNIVEYNKKVSADDRLPRIIVFHDEMADWMADSEDYRKMIQGKMTRLASKARACGMNIFLITQRASQDAIPVGIRDNLNNRLCLKVASAPGSLLALKVPGAERLLGRGHLAANLSGDRPREGEFFTAQVPFASTDQLERLGKAAISNWSDEG